MLQYKGALLASASDIVNYLGCPHRTTLDLIDLETPLEKAPDSEEMLLVQEKGRSHEAGFLEGLRKAGGLVEIVQEATLEERLERTREAMRAGAGVIYQAALREGPLIGHADFLRSVEGSSALGGWRYEVLDTKLALKTKAKFLIQLACYSDLVAAGQGVLPERAHLALGDGTEVHFRVRDYAHYYRNVRDRFLKHVEKVQKIRGQSPKSENQEDSGSDPSRALTRPEPVEACELCHWRLRCAAQWEAEDHLSRVAGMQKRQWRRLEAAGIGTMEALAALRGGTRVARMAPETLARLRAQARLQAEARRAGERRRELLEGAPYRGFARLPEPSEGDLYFDMEGDPFEKDGLEYLLGVGYREGGSWKYRRWWAHDRVEERAAFEGFMDFVARQLARFLDLHIYHYAAYEPSALKRLMSKHGVREVELDDCLRAERFVDLYRVVREALRISEPGYSLKDVEKFYAPPRVGEVASAGASIVYYEKWRETREPRLLESLEAYNRFDCDSTRGLHEWLLRLRPAGVAWFEGRGIRGQSPANQNQEDSGSDPTDPRREHEAALERYRKLLVRDGGEERELREDAECIAGMEADREAPPGRVKSSTVYTYRYPEQELKLEAGEEVLRADTAEPAGEIESIDEASRVLRLKVGPSRPRPPGRLSIGRGKFSKNKALQAALFRFADALLAGEARYRALRDLLSRKVPRRRNAGPMSLEEVFKLDESCLYIQGPPGSGKTWTGARLIVELLGKKKRIGISANSHKAIHELLRKVEEVAEEKGVRFRGVKKTAAHDPETKYEGRLVDNLYTNEDVVASKAQLLAGTVWLFADAALDQQLDTLFVDEAGQVALANLEIRGQGLNLLPRSWIRFEP